MSNVQAVTAEKLRTVKIVGWAYIVVGLVFVGHRISWITMMADRLAPSHAQPGQVPLIQSLVAVTVISLLSLSLGALLIGGAVHFLKLRESGRLTLVATSCVLAAFSLLRALSAIPTLVMMRKMSSWGSNAASLTGVAQRQLAAGVGSLLLAVVLIALLTVITRPGVKDCTLPPQRLAPPVLLPVPPPLNGEG